MVLHNIALNRNRAADTQSSEYDSFAHYISSEISELLDCTFSKPLS